VSVRELIDLLQNFPMDLPVKVDDDEYGARDIKEVYVERSYFFRGEMNEGGNYVSLDIR